MKFFTVVSYEFAFPVFRSVFRSAFVFWNLFLCHFDHPFILDNPDSSRKDGQSKPTTAELSILFIKLFPSSKSSSSLVLSIVGVVDWITALEAVAALALYSLIGWV